MDAEFIALSISVGVVLLTEVSKRTQIAPRYIVWAFAGLGGVVYYIFQANVSESFLSVLLDGIKSVFTYASAIYLASKGVLVLAEKR